MAVKRAALVTGASYGVGAATARALARDGFDVAVTATKVENLVHTVKMLEPSGVRVVPAELDPRSEASIARTAADVIAVLGGLDLLNNAGVNLRKLAAEVSREEWDVVMAVNVRGTFFLT
jgi:NAD(P)-dependent dehydrogenase (short-subunit alcohol dehydrogenase family)